MLLTANAIIQINYPQSMSFFFFLLLDTLKYNITFTIQTKALWSWHFIQSLNNGFKQYIMHGEGFPIQLCLGVKWLRAELQSGVSGMTGNQSSGRGVERSSRYTNEGWLLWLVSCPKDRRFVGNISPPLQNTVQCLFLETVTFSKTQTYTLYFIQGHLQFLVNLDKTDFGSFCVG